MIVNVLISVMTALKSNKTKVEVESTSATLLNISRSIGS